MEKAVLVTHPAIKMLEEKFKAFDNRLEAYQDFPFAYRTEATREMVKYLEQFMKNKTQENLLRIQNPVLMQRTKTLIQQQNISIER